MSGLLKNIQCDLAKLAIKSLLRTVATRQKSRAEIILHWLAFGKQKEGDFLCSLYYFILENILSRFSKENDINPELVRKVAREYPIFRRSINKGLDLFLNGLEQYGLTTPQRLSAPLMVEFEVTKACNLKCKHCFASAGKKMENELSTADAKKIIEQISDAGVPVICFTGGEPLLRKDFLELLEYSKSKNIATIVLTNGTLLTKAKAKKMKELDVDYVRVSLDAPKAKFHDWLRGIPGTFNKTIKGIENCVDAGIQTGMGAVIIKDNSEEIGDLIDLAAEMGCCDITTCRLFPLGLGKEFTNRLLTSQETEEIEKLLMEKSKKYQGKLFINPLTLSTRRMRGMSGRIAEIIGGCPAGIAVSAITPDGDVKPCTIMSLSVGNLNKQSFIEIWRESKVFGELRDRSLLKGKCSKCEFKYSCGGCRATAYGYYGDYLESDPITCMYYKGI